MLVSYTQVLAESRRGHQIPWSWNELPDVGARNQSQVPWMKQHTLLVIEATLQL